MKIIYFIFFLIYLNIGELFAQKTKPYETLINHFDINYYLKNPNHSLDSNGIIMTNSKYHPLNICMYGILNCEKYQLHHDPINLLYLKNQFKYFKDTTNLLYSDNNQSIGLPYQFDYNGLKAPWISGMTQGLAASFLLRYFELTNDSTALFLCEKMIHLLKKSEKDGGTISHDENGAPFIEEYPNHKSSRSVLNGFINGLIGLYEYTQYFPNDLEAHELFQQCYKRMISNFDLYDNNYNWTSYNRNGWKISKSYFLYQIFELDHLYSIFKDENLKNELKIWMKLSYLNLGHEMDISTHPNYKYSAVMQKDTSNNSFFYKDSILFEASLIEYFKGSRNKINQFNINFIAPIYYCTLEGENLHKGNNTIYKAYHNKKEIAIKITYNLYGINIESEKPFDQIKITNSQKKAKKFTVESCKTIDLHKYKLPMFITYDLPEIIELKKGKSYKCEVKSANITNAKIYYRCADILDVVNESIYSIKNCFDVNNDEIFIAPMDGFYEFFIGYDVTHPLSTLSDCKIIEIK